MIVMFIVCVLLCAIIYVQACNSEEIDVGRKFYKQRYQEQVKINESMKEYNDALKAENEKLEEECKGFEGYAEYLEYLNQYLREELHEKDLLVNDCQK
jgi:cell division protein FtsB